MGGGGLDHRCGGGGDSVKKIHFAALPHFIIQLRIDYEYIIVDL